MGIKKLYDEIGAGERVSLAGLAVKNFEETGRPMRLAIDASIWQFQVQSGKGGKNPALRTLYYRLRRLLCHCIQPILIFDGPNRPPFKRGHRTTANPLSHANILVKQLLDLLGIPHLDAPGEAEAECAMLQRAGIVDAVLTEDVDALMFGCGVMLRQWSAERGTAPTHVTKYDLGRCSLTMQGMLLVALMSGGDYNPAGIPKCGVKIACEAARAGFGEKLCDIPVTETGKIRAWRDGLEHELHTNESKFFSCKHKSLRIPPEFPDKTILGYYRSPTVSSSSDLDVLRTRLQWKDIDLMGLREFVAQHFEWMYRSGAVKLVRTIAEPLMLRGLILECRPGYQDSSQLIKGISSGRAGFDTDAKPEYRVEYLPLEVVSVDLDAEEENAAIDTLGGKERSAESPSSGEASEDPDTQGESGTFAPKRRRSRFDPTQPQRTWIPEAFVKRLAPLAVSAWEQKQQDVQKRATEKEAKRQRNQKAKAQKRNGGMKEGAMYRHVTVTKLTSNRSGVPNKPRPVLSTAEQNADEGLMAGLGPGTQASSKHTRSEAILVASSPEPPEDRPVRQSKPEKVASGNREPSKSRPPGARLKRDVALRDSVDGAWKPISAAELAAATSSGAGSQTRVYADVEVIDLS